MFGPFSISEIIGNAAPDSSSSGADSDSPDEPGALFTPKNRSGRPGLTPRGQSFLIFVFYTILIVGTFVWSGRGADLTVYDRVVIDWGGMVLPVRDLTKSERFYRDFLDLPRVVPGGQTFIESSVSKTERPCFSLPAKKPLCLTARPVGLTPGGETANGIKDSTFKEAEVVVYVKSGFQNLYDLLKSRVSLVADKDHTDVVLTPIGLDGDLEFFTATDPDGNRIIFRRTKWFKLPNRKAPV